MMLLSKIVFVPKWLNIKVGDVYSKYIDCAYLSSILSKKDLNFYILDNKETLESMFDPKYFNYIHNLPDWSQVEIPQGHVKEFQYVEKTPKNFRIVIVKDVLLLIENDTNLYENKTHLFYRDIILNLSKIDSFDVIRKTNIFRTYLELPRV